MGRIDGAERRLYVEPPVKVGDLEYLALHKKGRASLAPLSSGSAVRFGLASAVAHRVS